MPSPSSTAHARPSAYADATAPIPIADDEQPVADLIRQRLHGFQFLLSSILLDAEIRAVYASEGHDFDRSMLPELDDGLSYD